MNRSQRMSIFFFAQLIAIALLFGCASTPGRDKPLGNVMSMAVSPDSNLIAVSTNSQEVAFFDVSPLRFRSLLNPEGVKMNPKLDRLFRSPPLAFSPDGRYLAATANLSLLSVSFQVFLTDLRSNQTRTITGTYGCSVAFTKDSKLLITGGLGAPVLWDLETG